MKVVQQKETHPCGKMGMKKKPSVCKSNCSSSTTTMMGKMETKPKMEANEDDYFACGGASRSPIDISDLYFNSFYPKASSFSCGEEETLILSQLKNSLSEEDELSETNWLTSRFIDLIFVKFALLYPQVYFLPSDFVPLHFASTKSENVSTPTDILGRLIDVSCDDRPIVFIHNVSQIHWILFRVQFKPHAELQLFEPMGRPSSRMSSSVRSVPRPVIKWLDHCWPQQQGKTWLRKTVSAITKQHQISGFDCGIACLLYAEKCGQGQRRQDINEWTDQVDITTFRKELQMQIENYKASLENRNSNNMIF